MKCLATEGTTYEKCKDGTRMEIRKASKSYRQQANGNKVPSLIWVIFKEIK